MNLLTTEVVKHLPAVPAFAGVSSRRSSSQFIGDVTPNKIVAYNNTDMVEIKRQ